MGTSRILATSGGFIATDRWAVMEPGGNMRELLRLTGKQRPRLTLVMTASGDDRSYLTRAYAAFRGWSVEVTHLELFSQPNTDPRTLLMNSDAIWVGGGSVANLLAVWRVHGLETILREAWSDGIVLGGVSAGSICWHVGGTTDSFGPELVPVTNGLGLLPYGNGVHYDSEAQRRPLLHETVIDQVLPLSYATDDGIGILYEGIDAVEVVADRSATEAAAYRIEKSREQVIETRLPVGRISG